MRADDPLLTSRGLRSPEPLRVVLSRSLALPEAARLWDRSVAPTLVAHGYGAPPRRRFLLDRLGVERLVLSRCDPLELLEQLGQRGCNQVLWECGPTLAAAALQAGAVQDIAAVIAPRPMGGLPARTPLDDLGYTAMEQVPHWRGDVPRRLGDDCSGACRPPPAERSGLACSGGSVVPWRLPAGLDVPPSPPSISPCCWVVACWRWPAGWGCSCWPDSPPRQPAAPPAGARPPQRGRHPGGRHAVWWLFERFGWDLSRNGTEVRQWCSPSAWSGRCCAARAPSWPMRRSTPAGGCGAPGRPAFLLDVLDKLVSGAVLLLATLEVLRLLGVSLTVLITASGFGAAALGFGARTLVENLLGGLMLYLHRPFVIGDFIRLPALALEGTVQEIGFYYTQLITPDRQPLYVPNATFATSAILNGARRDHRQVLVSFGVRYDDQPLLETIIHRPAAGTRAAEGRGCLPAAPGALRGLRRIEPGSAAGMLLRRQPGCLLRSPAELLQRIGRVVAECGASMPFPTRLLLGTGAGSADLSSG